MTFELILPICLQHWNEKMLFYLYLLYDCSLLLPSLLLVCGYGEMWTHTWLAVVLVYFFRDCLFGCEAKALPWVAHIIVVMPSHELTYDIFFGCDTFGHLVMVLLPVITHLHHDCDVCTSVSCDDG